jgi:DNA-binding LytR/AlgR family response regulator
MVRVFWWDGQEVFINPDNIMFIQIRDKYTSVIMVNGKDFSLSLASYEILTGMVPPKKGNGKAGFDVI